MQAKQVLSAFDGCMIYLYPNITNVNIYEFCHRICWIMFQLFHHLCQKKVRLVIVIVIFFLDISVQEGKVQGIIPM